MAQPLLSAGQEYIPDEPVEVSPNERIYNLEVRVAELALEFANEVSALRQQIERMQHGMAIAAGEAPSSYPNAPPAPQFDQRWDAWKQKLGLGTAPARVIDALLKHGPMNRTQLRHASETGWSTLDAATSRLRNLSLIEKQGDRWNLKTS